LIVMPEDEEGGLEEMRRRKLQEQLGAMQADEEQRRVLMAILEPEAFSRLANVRLSNPKLYQKLVSLLFNLVQSGQLKGRISEAQLKALLLKFTSRPQGSISFKRK